MSETVPTPEREPRATDAARLAELVYYTLDREVKASDPNANTEIGEVRESIVDYLGFRATQDPEMGEMLIAALTTFQDPSPELASPEAAEAMSKTVAQLRRQLEDPSN